jgi:hypothetical protein
MVFGTHTAKKSLVRKSSFQQSIPLVAALGYPHDLNRSPEQSAVMTGGRFDQIDYPTRVVR